ncbi:COMM domain-containing protein 5-like Protein [Tribolium castaneum]|uniref:COMM domain-containing protein 5 n=1 Tax=Tribolium castaneum TaxID=7070 RepID=D7EL49_TRICA|nr:PREDICTED: COMM domain-containing protein 5 [Tribolium castaneum]XP_008193664.1 PREDICTED: COMM domain-containing protein 5 [Tribolium castaneum]EFA11877.1 COMM domain-containing protein 5-like Protein [Tribolium castaneum]|eukprot:XP_008193657.1 PREDICTED: COMM domain-containing protein 5 [Tribolium castaneum]
MNLNEIPKTVALATSQCPPECLNNILKVALSINQSPTQDRLKVIEKISNDFDLPKEKTIEILGVYLAIIRTFVASTDKEFNAKLKELGFSNEFIEELPLINNRTKVMDTILSSRRGEFNKLVSLKWRIDISLTNSALVKKLPTSVILCLQLKNGRKYTINLNIKTFHKLRFNVALIMKEINQLNK